MQSDIKLIACPEHPEAGHKAILYCYPSDFAGIWECPGGTSDTHVHSDLEVKTVTEDHMGIDGHYQTEQRVYVCGGSQGCGVVIEDEDPDLDAYEARVDG